jgi:hypothetical protein
MTHKTMVGQRKPENQVSILDQSGFHSADYRGTMSYRSINLLRMQMEEAWESLPHRLEGLTDEEFFWKPVVNCWTVHPVENGR